MKILTGIIRVSHAILLLVSIACYALPSHAAIDSDTTSIGSGQPPNIVIIMADDLGYGDLSSYEGWIQTSFIDRLAEEGMRFTDFHSSGVVCSPTRAGLMTGRYQQRASIPDVIFADPTREEHFHGLQSQELTFAELFQEQGYTTGIFGKWHLGYLRKYNPVHQGFGEFRGYVSGNIDYISHVDQAGNRDWWKGNQLFFEEGYSTHLITKHAVRFIEENKNKPFCLYVAHEAPHSPFQGPDDPSDRIPGGTFDVRGSRDDRKEAYREMVQEMDKGIGQIVETLRRLGLDRQTFVIFFSDNGAGYGSNEPLRGSKGQVWEGGHRVPAIAWWPGHIESGQVTDQLAISLDVFPTILDVAGIKSPASHLLDGRSLLPVLTKGASLEERTLFWQHGNQLAMRRGPWKLVHNAPGLEDEGTGEQGKAGLFNLQNDISESGNQAADHPNRVKTMLQALRTWEDEVTKNATPQP